MNKSANSPTNTEVSKTVPNEKPLKTQDGMNFATRARGIIIYKEPLREAVPLGSGAVREPLPYSLERFISVDCVSDTFPPPPKFLKKTNTQPTTATESVETLPKSPTTATDPVDEAGKNNKENKGSGGAPATTDPSCARAYSLPYNSVTKRAKVGVFWFSSDEVVRLQTEFGDDCFRYYLRVCSEWLKNRGETRENGYEFVRKWIVKNQLQRTGFYE